MPRPAGCDLLGPARGLCASCVLSPREVERVRAAVVYDDLARSFLLRAKVGARRDLLRPIGSQMAALARADGIGKGCVAVIPAPSHPWNDLRRGFSPSATLARQVASSLGIPLLSGVLGRRFGLRPPSTRSRGRLRRDSAATIRLKAPLRCHPGPVLLVDDVMTTGETVEACARALKKGGADRVRALVWARTLPDRRQNRHGLPHQDA